MIRKIKSRRELNRRIKELEEVVLEMRKELNEEELSSFPWIGNLGQWHWMVKSNEVEFNEKKLTNLGYDMKDLPEKIGFEFFTSKLHKEDYARVMENMKNHLTAKSDAYEVEYRIKAKNGKYVWYYDRGKVTKRDKDGNPIVVSGMVFDINKNKLMERQLRKANIKLKKLVSTDELTGAFNRRYFLEKTEDEIKRYNRRRIDFSIIMLDIDHFKLVNDHYGHNAGDLVLKKLVELLQNRIRKTDVLCRWGGEEFIMLLVDTSMEDAAILAEDIRQRVSDMDIKGVEPITASFGVASYAIDDTIDMLIKKADDLMCKAKSEGRNCVRY